MNTESNKVLFLGIGESGLKVAEKINGKEAISVIKTCVINKESEFKKLDATSIREAELMILVADLGNKKENSLALKAAKWVKDEGKTVAAILTTPRLFEGEKTIMRALETAHEIGRVVDSSMIINKENFNSLPEEGSTFEDLINSLVSEEEEIISIIQNIIHLVSGSGIINLDLDNLKMTLDESGIFAIESGLGTGENRISMAIANVLSSSLMKKCDIFTSRRVLIKVLSPKNSPVNGGDMKAVSEFVEKLPRQVDVKWGIGEADDDDILSVIILASGFDVKLPE